MSSESINFTINLNGNAYKGFSPLSIILYHFFLSGRYNVPFCFFFITLDFYSIFCIFVMSSQGDCPGNTSRGGSLLHRISQLKHKLQTYAFFISTFF